jgi:hypothetical protein
MNSHQRPALSALYQWTPAGRALTFFLAATSIWCLLAEFYGLCSMRTFTFAILLPATALLLLMTAMDYIKGDRRLFKAVVVGAIGGFVAAVAYDLFRLPWVLGAADQVGPWWMRLPLFKVFPRFGAMILGEPYSAATPDSQFSLAAHLVGWTYHFSNGITFGVMYMAMIGDATKRSWLWAIALAAGLELAMLLTPYTRFFGIHLAALFVVVTLTAHIIFGVAMGLYTRHAANRWQLTVPAPTAT